MEYKNEVGIVVSENNDGLCIVDGFIGHVDFPHEFIWEVHKIRPGYIDRIAHTHPPEMTQLSNRDEQTLKTWAFALFPFPIKMSTITLVGKTTFRETIYRAYLEPKEVWKKHGGKRVFNIVEEHVHEFVDPIEEWMKIALKKSYNYDIV